MSSEQLLKQIRQRASLLKRSIVLPDATDQRTIQAARILTDNGIARIFLIGDETVIRQKGKSAGIDLDGINIIEPSKSANYSEFSLIFQTQRKEKGITIAEARETMVHPLYFGAMMVRQGLADGSVAGSLSTTAHVLRAAIQVIGIREGVSSISSSFLMVFSDRVFSFADCAVIPEPSPGQLAEIAILTAENHRKLTGQEPRVAMLSFSTKGSATHSLAEKVQQATELAARRAPNLTLDGELQLDAAIVPDVARSKASGSPVQGNANVLIFPDLNAGNIAYKLAQRLGGAVALGPIVQGLRKPAFDLSRGCSVQDIVDTVAINGVMGE